jgi:enterochelin esterase-like enzyme
MRVADLTVSLRILVGGHDVASWRINVLAILARLLRVQLDIGR